MLRVPIVQNIPKFVPSDQYNLADTVSLKSGSVQGEDRGGVKIFRGIPYGDSVSGINRFRRAQPAKPWDGVLDCRTNGPIAVQLGGSIFTSPLGDYFSGGQQEKFGALDEVQSEDCLVLNVLTNSYEGKRPVMVYFHGGGLDTGSGTLTIGADNFVRENDIVLVGVNHRLNVFGYLYLGGIDPSYGDSGLAGINDLALALEWVKENISRFGGDPDNVTIFGESGGGLKVSTMLAMKNARGLFHKAIVGSGSFPVCVNSPEAATATTRAVMAALGLQKDDVNGLINAKAEDLLEAFVAIGTPNLTSLGIVADNVNLDFNPTGWFVAPEVSRDIPLMIGASADELAVFFYNAPNEILTWENLADKLAEKCALPQLRAFAHAKADLTAENSAALVKAFREENAHGDDPEHTLQKIISQATFLGGTAFYEAMAKSAASDAPVYLYSIEYDSPHPVLKDRKYAWHTADLPLQMRIVLHPESEAFSRTMAAQIAAFAKTGNPSIEGLAWPAFTPERRSVMVMDDVFHVEIDPDAKLREVMEIK